MEVQQQNNALEQENDDNYNPLFDSPRRKNKSSDSASNNDGIELDMEVDAELTNVNTSPLVRFINH